MKSIETEHGTIQFKESVAPPGSDFKGIIRDLTMAERDEMQQTLERVGAFIDKYVPEERKGKDLLENLDLAYSEWLHATDANKEDPKTVETLIGTAFGEYCVDRLSLKWAVVIDDQGTELALVGENPPSRSYPLASVRYRIEDQKEDFIAALFEAIKHTRAAP